LRAARVKAACAMTDWIAVAARDVRALAEALKAEVTEPEARVAERLNAASVSPPSAAGVMGALARGFESHRAPETETSPGSVTSVVVRIDGLRRL
jgi:hypothetical protein